MFWWFSTASFVTEDGFVVLARVVLWVGFSSDCSCCCCCCCCCAKRSWFCWWRRFTRFACVVNAVMAFPLTEEWCRHQLWWFTHGELAVNKICDFIQRCLHLSVWEEAVPILKIWVENLKWSNRPKHCCNSISKLVLNSFWMSESGEIRSGRNGFCWTRENNDVGECGIIRAHNPQATGLQAPNRIKIL